ncbi:thiol-disulfide oxidoreductase DCC family protein [Pseudovibrio sp. FO-BEG1]|uniref:thiol-disulfide oxidoreductase DCC family protein n=1 Tax=Pseudovibrio sp. (strain FO-BEG1) TaxID=911045 RepID=UPI0005A2D135|nr:DCC1-like thiol-disulfide oxidoreductase family protein [Pseudovibrio sp. FO-BEG1]
MEIKQRQFSYWDDASIPPFPDQGPVSVMDASCGLCAKGAAWIARNDRNQEFRIIPLQSKLGEALASHYGLDPANPSSWLYLENRTAYTSLDALVHVGERLGGIWKALRILMILPKPLRDRMYSVVARNRYKFFGRTDLCSTQDPELRKRLLL